MEPLIAYRSLAEPHAVTQGFALFKIYKISYT